ncbi:N-acyl-D-glutamate deacylase [Tolypocladium ophioglossoides CBS 100239]|uniref:N-acyl-D-glutamate deacylase n=1 Tax=Tolypocladium ophioglossoides (strain CBS 100239) TaxID=1163406 RepID=A0A0L0N3M5_TOLOC|nr:N-acyl-D-glutamate deacylase [Tolypocladium ophioglossoides CBS 100239]
MLSDILFLSATVVSGDEGAEPFIADVLVSDGLIAEIGAPGSIEGRSARRIDAKGHYLSPGFIDMHAHSDLYLLTHPDHEPKISQGCTTEVVGQDGISYAPIRNPHQLQAIRDQIAGWNGNPTDEACRTTHKGVGIFEWQTVGEYLDCLERNRTATNVAMLVPQGNLRLLACGPYDTPATPDEIQDQVQLLREAMGQGAVGMSSGLTYTPGMYASTSELAVLCKALAAEYPGAFYAPHHRSYGFRAIESYAEMLELGQTTGCPVHLTHATLNFSENKGKAPVLLSMIDKTLAEGVDITLDPYPYLPGCTTLASLLPGWASAGGPSETLQRLEDAATREKIRVAIEVTGCDGGHGIPTNWDEIQIGTVGNPSLASYSGRRLGEVARSLNKPPIEVFFDILQKDRLATSSLMHVGNEENVRQIMQHRVHMGGSDAILHGKSLHPRAYGTFTRYLGHYSRELAILPLPAMVAHLTSRPAKRLSVYPHRGLIAKGSAADLVLFDPEAIKDMATFEEPKLPSRGIRFVLVNGEVALDEGKMTGARGGKTLRRMKDGKVAARGEQ